MKKKILLFVTFLLLLGFWLPFLIGNLYPNEYSIGNMKFKKPDGFYFHSFISSQEQQNAMCIYSFSCKSQFEFDGSMSVITFKELPRHYVTIVIKQYYGDHTILNSKSFENYFDCKISKLDESDDYFINGFSRDKNISFTIFSDEKDQLERSLKHLCN